MSGRRWWDLGFTGIPLLLVVVALTTAGSMPPGPAWEPYLGAAAMVGVSAAWWLGGWRAADRPTVRAVMRIVLLVLLLGGISVNGNLAVLQMLVYPFFWTTATSYRSAVVVNTVTGAVVAVGFAIFYDFRPEAVPALLGIVAFSQIMTMGLGTWMWRVGEWGDERARLLAELEATQDALAAMHRDAGVTSERERIARELHDTIAQTLTGLTMLAQQARTDLARGDADRAVQRLELVEQGTREALAETRALVASTARVDLTGGLSASLERLAARFTRETGVAVDVHADDGIRLQRDAQVVLLRCAQEALANVRKHAGAGAVTVALTADDATVALRVRDDGVGFDPDAAGDGFGLTGMRDRLELVGGALDVRGSDAGTVLVATLPRDAEPAAPTAAASEVPA